MIAARVVSAAEGQGELYSALLRRGISRRAFMRFCVASTAALALPAAYAPRIAAAIQAAPRVPVVWLRGLSCGGDSAALLRADHPSVGEVILDLLSFDYDESLMAASGEPAERARAGVATGPGGFLAIVEGAIPSGDQAGACTVGGRPIRDVVSEVSRAARLTIAIGTCATDGGLPAAGGGTTGASGIGGLVPSGRLVSLPGCPVNPANLTAVLVHFLTFDAPPATDPAGRPLFAYGALVHNLCERRAHFEFGEFVQAWGDEAAQKGWCLYKVGCKGPETFANCPTVRFGDGTSWPVQAGQVCIGCTMPGFWDVMSPFHERLPAFLPFLPDVTADQAGGILVGGVIAAAGAHGAASYVRQRLISGTDGGSHRGEPVPEVAPPAEVSAAQAEVEPTADTVAHPPAPEMSGPEISGPETSEEPATEASEEASAAAEASEAEAH